IVIGMTVMRLVLPFAPATIPPAAGEDAATKLPGIVDFLLSLIPTNIVDVAARGLLLPLIVFTIFFAAATSTLSQETQARLTGLALFQGAAIIFLASLYHVPLPPAAIVAAVLATFVVAQTVASVPSASIVSMQPALATLGIPLAGLGLILGVDRIPDMFRTT